MNRHVHRLLHILRPLGLIYAKIGLAFASWPMTQMGYTHPDFPEVFHKVQKWRDLQRSLNNF